MQWPEIKVLNRIPNRRNSKANAWGQGSACLSDQLRGVCVTERNAMPISLRKEM